MDHLSNPEQPAYVADRVSAVSNVPMQFLMSVGMVAVILVAALLTDAISAGEDAISAGEGAAAVHPPSNVANLCASPPVLATIRNITGKVRPGDPLHSAARAGAAHRPRSPA
jgi:hypothetical protein